MSNYVRRKLIFAGFIIGMIFVIYINLNSKKVFSNYDNGNVSEKVNISTQDIKELSAWVAYWDLNTDEEIKALDGRLKDLCYFAANYNSENELVIPEKLIGYYNKTKNNAYNKYITIVNDKTNRDGSTTLKDTELLKDLLSSSDSRSNHIIDIINLANNHDFDGIEIDYEQIKNDMELWQNYILFIDELYNQCEKLGLKLRVVLEPNIPFNKLSFNEGPAYVIMCYNLHGGFSLPGEKANPEFIRGLIEKARKIPGKKIFAIATGGFNWASNGKTTSISEVDANILLKENNAKLERDDKSHCLFFNYIDKDNIEHEVWYADAITLEYWMKTINEQEDNISIWRLGGNLLKE